MHLKKEVKIAIACFLGWVPVLLIPIGLGWTQNLTSILDMIIAAGVISIIATGCVFLYRGIFVKKSTVTESGRKKVFPNGLSVGKPYDDREGVYRYKEKDMPIVMDMIDKAEKEIGALLVGGYGLLGKIERELDRITSKKKLTLCIQPADAPVVERQSQHSGSPNLKEKITEIHTRLFRIRRILANKENLFLRNHEHYLTHSIMVFDPDGQYPHVRVVEYSRENDDNWDGRIIFKKDNPEEYHKYFKEYDEVIRNESHEMSEPSSSEQETTD